MSLIATLYGNDAIVMASDSRLTTNLTPKETLGEDGVKTIEKTKGIFMSDTAHKTFLCPNGCGISYCGDSSFGNFTIEAILKNFIALHISKSVAVKDIPQLLQDFIQTNYTGLSTRFHVAGYSADDKMQNLFSVDTNPKNPQPKMTMLTLKRVKEMFEFMEDIEYKIIDEN